MADPGKELELVVPDRLARLAEAGRLPRSVDAPGPSGHHRREIHPFDTRGSVQAVGPTDASRIRRVLGAELQSQQPAYLRPRWLEFEEAVPNLLVSLRYERQDAHGITSRVRDLDLALRRAAATLENYNLREQNAGWAYPLRPERGGLWILESRRGSYKLSATVYGTLVAWATSAPVSLASLASLAWDSAVIASRAGQWFGGHFHGPADDGPPELGSTHSNAKFGLKQTKVLEPVMLEAVKSGSGFEFVNNSDTGGNPVDGLCQGRTGLRISSLGADKTATHSTSAPHRPLRAGPGVSYRRLSVRLVVSSHADERHHDQIKDRLTPDSWPDRARAYR